MQPSPTLVNGLNASSPALAGNAAGLEHLNAMAGGHQLPLDPVLRRARRGAFHILNNDFPCGSLAIPKIRNIPAHKEAVDHKVERRLELQLCDFIDPSQHFEVGIPLSLGLRRKGDIVQYGSFRAEFVSAAPVN